MIRQVAGEPHATAASLFPPILEGEVNELSQWLRETADIELQPFLVERLIFDIGGAHASELRGVPSW
ncbi:MAG: hypothetical protein R3C56_34495 [Pirellulaceae bacterium]